MKISKFILIPLFVFIATPTLFAGTNDILSPEETLWLEQRNNTIVIYPEQNNPPYSYQSASGNLQGLSIDYLELIAEKINAKIEYLTPRSRSQIRTDIQAGKGDVIAFSVFDKDKEEYLIFTESYVTIPVVIVVRKDYSKKSGLTLNDFNGKRVTMIDSSVAEVYVKTNYPRVIREPVTDDEVSLQQLVLGEVDAAVMDVTSLSFFLSKQILSSVKVAGNTGLDYEVTFALPKDRTLLQSILEKGLMQISANDRSLLADKWIALPGETLKNEPFLATVTNNLSTATLYMLFGVGVLTILVLIVTRRYHRERYFRKVHDIDELKEEFSELEGENNILTHELEQVRIEEAKLKEKIEMLRK